MAEPAPGQSTQGRYSVVPRVLIFLTHRDDVLLLRGGPAKWFAGRLNGIGGHVEPGEDIKTAAKRETLEETGLEVDDLDLRAIIHVQSGPPPGVMLFVFHAAAPRRETRPSDEGDLLWAPRAEIDALPVLDDLRWLLPRLWEHPSGSQPLYATFLFEPEGLKIMCPPAT